MTHTCWKNLLCAVWVAMLGLTSLVSMAANTQLYQVVDGVVVYFGVIPAEMIRGHVKSHPESQMHGGIPTNRSYHLTVAIFDEKSGERLTDVEVIARVIGKSESGSRKVLEPMIIAGSRSYGNYFRMPGDGPYRIELEIRNPKIPQVIRTTFVWGRS